MTSVRPLVAALLVLPLAGAALLVAAEFSTLYEVEAGGEAVAAYRSGGHHGWALLPIAAAIALMAWGAALRGSRPAAVAVVVLGAAALVLAWLVLLPDTDETGLFARTYEAAQATPGPAVPLAFAGGALAVAGGVALLVVRTPARRRRAAGRTPASAA